MASATAHARQTRQRHSLSPELYKDQTKKVKDRRDALFRKRLDDLLAGRVVDLQWAPLDFDQWQRVVLEAEIVTSVLQEVLDETDEARRISKAALIQRALSKQAAALDVFADANILDPRAHLVEKQRLAIRLAALDAAEAFQLRNPQDETDSAFSSADWSDDNPLSPSPSARPVPYSPGFARSPVDRVTPSAERAGMAANQHDAAKPARQHLAEALESTTALPPGSPLGSHAGSRGRVDFTPAPRAGAPAVPRSASTIPRAESAARTPRSRPPATPWSGLASEMTVQRSSDLRAKMRSPGGSKAPGKPARQPVEIVVELTAAEFAEVRARRRALKVSWGSTAVRG